MTHKATRLKPNHEEQQSRYEYRGFQLVRWVGNHKFGWCAYRNGWSFPQRSFKEAKLWVDDHLKWA